MIKVGLTGSIGMGKSTVCGFFRAMGVKVWSADEAVHELYDKDGAAVEPISKYFPNAINENGAIDRNILSKLLIANSKIVLDLEEIVHPLVKKHRENFASKHSNESLLVFDIPLLFETNAMAEFDKIILVDCDPEIQKKRVMARPGMSEEKFETIIKRQIPNNIKAAKADIIIDTNRPLPEVEEQVRKILIELIGPKNA